MNTALIEIRGYTIHSLLGKGGMAEVYLATQDSLRRKVAIKVLLSTDDDSFNQRFINEGHIVASLNHPAIITIYDINQLADGRYYLAMEFIGGGDLAQYKSQAFDPLRALGIIKQLAEGLAVIHDRGLVHRDIKPANILFRQGDQVVITDFGIAKSLDIDSELTQHGMVVGSPAYSSPEQAQCQAIDQRTDIYSLGVILLEMLLGRNLYRGDSYTQTVLNHVQMPVPALPPELAAYQPLLDKMLAKNPDDRFRDCHALLVDINRVMQQAVAVAPSEDMDQTRVGAAVAIPVAQPQRGFSRKHGLILAAIGLVLALAAAAYPLIAKKIKVHGYLQQAEQRLASKQLINPPADNADYFYRQALALEPDNRAAAEGLQKVKDARIAQLLAQAEQFLANNQLLTPKDDNAVARFRQVLALQAGQPAAVQGLHRVATIYQGLAQDAHAQGKTAAALDYLDSGLQVEADNRDLLKLQKDYAADKPASDTTTPAGKKKSRKKSSSSLERFWHKLIGK